jgi:hypothetical protein
MHEYHITRVSKVHLYICMSVVLLPYSCHKCNIILKGTNQEINWSVATLNYACWIPPPHTNHKQTHTHTVAYTKHIYQNSAKENYSTHTRTNAHKPKLKRFLYLIDGNRIVMIIWVLNKRFKQICIICKRFVPRGWFLSL